MQESIKDKVNINLDKINDFIGDSSRAAFEGGKKVVGSIGSGIKDVGNFIRTSADTTDATKAADITDKVFNPATKGLPTSATPNTVTEQNTTDATNQPYRSIIGEEPVATGDAFFEAEKVKPSFNLNPEFDDEDEDEDDDIDLEEQRRREYLAGERELARRDKGDETSNVSKVGAVQQYHEELKLWENVNNSGYRNGRFLPFKSVEGTGSDETNSEYEIGYGIKIKQSWLSDNRKDWPMINGVPTDIREGISKKQAEVWCYELQNQAYETAKKNIPTASWDKLSEVEKTFWTDLAYNAGEAGIKGNVKAKESLAAGHSVEGMVKCLDYINANGKPYRGLLNRRVSMYNAAALDAPGSPVIKEYEIKEDGTVHLKFSSSFNTSKISPGFAKQLNKDKGFTFKAKPGLIPGVYKAGKGYSFR
jgi:hypothetical protein